LQYKDGNKQTLRLPLEPEIRARVKAWIESCALPLSPEQEALFSQPVEFTVFEVFVLSVFSFLLALVNGYLFAHMFMIESLDLHGILILLLGFDFLISLLFSFWITRRFRQYTYLRILFANLFCCLVFVLFMSLSIPFGLRIVFG
jgi:hypothetical protein